MRGNPYVEVFPGEWKDVNQSLLGSVSAPHYSDIRSSNFADIEQDLGIEYRGANGDTPKKD